MKPPMKQERPDSPGLSPLQQAPRSLRSGERGLLAGLIGIFLILGIMHAGIVPLGQTGYQDAPDEAAHATYVRTLAGGRLPVQADAASDPTAYEWHQPPLYYALAAAVDSSGERGARYLSLVFGALSIGLIFCSARLLFPGRVMIAFLAVAFAALLPTHIAICSAVNNDSLLELFFSWSAYLIIASLLSGFSMQRAVLLGAAIGGACLTKATGFLLVPVFVFALLLLPKAGENRRDNWRNAAVSFGVILVTVGWWLVRNARLYGELLPLKAFSRMFEHTALAQDVMSGKIPLGSGGAVGYIMLVGQWTFQSFFAVFGNPRSAVNGVPLFLRPETVYLLPLTVVIAAGAGMTRLHFERKQAFSPAQRYGLWVLFAIFSLTGLSFAGFVAKYFQAQGRYMFPAMLPLSLIVGAGWERATRGQRQKELAGLFGFIFIALCALFFMNITK